MSFEFKQVEQEFDRVIDHISREIGQLRTGKATPQLLDSVSVEAYGARMKINELANITAPDPTLLVVSPWDKSVLEAIERAIATAQINLNPIVDKDIIRIAVPPLTEERRREMVKVLHAQIEEGKKMLRTVRGEAKRSIEQMKNTDGVSEDDIRSDVEKLEEVMKTFLEKLDAMSSLKESELMKV